MSSERSRRRRIQFSTQQMLLEIDSELQPFTANLINLSQESQTRESDSHDGCDEMDTQSFSSVTSDSVDVGTSSSQSSAAMSHAGSVREDLAKWALRHNVTSSAIDDLLMILRPVVPNCGLPKSSKTLLSTPIHYQICDLAGGQYYHFGLRRALNAQSELQDDALVSGTITLTFGIDGVPISRSSKKQFWPILCQVDQSLNRTPKLIGLFFGEQKPQPLTDYSKSLVEELVDVQKSGVLINSVLYKVAVRCFIADAPARSYLKQVAGHNAYFGCERCLTKGTWEKKVIFQDLMALRRTDESFRLRLQPQHHTGESPLSVLGIGMVTQFPLDYMHLTCLGVMRKLLHIWYKGKIPFRECRTSINLLSFKLIECRHCVPSEFNRKPRSLSDLAYWKATEFRLFLLYLGPVLLKGILNQQKYQHFLLLSVAIRILLSDNTLWYDLAKQILIEFVSKFPSLYSKTFLTYNVHSLIHLADDAKLYGSLDRISAFPYENYMQTLKRHLRANHSHLAQVVRRVHEREGLFDAMNSQSQLRDRCVPPHFNVIHSERESDACFLLGSDIVLVKKLDFAVGMAEVQKFRVKESFFSYPIDSGKISIFRVSNLSCTFNIIPVNNLTQKFVKLPVDDSSWVCLQLIQHNE